MIVPYTELPHDAGGWPRPILDIAVGDMDELLVPCLVDSGAIHTLLPSWVAKAAAMGLEGAPTTILGVGGASTTATLTRVRVAAGGHTWEPEVAFCDPWPYSWGLLGQTSFFRYFTVTFRAADFEFEVNPIAD